MKFLIGLFVLLFVAIGAAEARAHDFTVVSYGLLHFADGVGVGVEITAGGQLESCVIGLTWPARPLPPKPALAESVMLEATPPAGEPFRVRLAPYRVIAAPGHVVREGARWQFSVESPGRTKAMIKLSHAFVRALAEAGIREIGVSVSFRHADAEFVGYLYQYPLAPAPKGPAPPWKGPWASRPEETHPPAFLFFSCLR